jgi:hypothetical protein
MQNENGTVSCSERLPLMGQLYAMVPELALLRNENSEHLKPCRQAGVPSA